LQNCGELRGATLSEHRETQGGAIGWSRKIQGVLNLAGAWINVQKRRRRD